MRYGLCLRWCQTASPSPLILPDGRNTRPQSHDSPCQASSLATARAFNSKTVPHPHGNALSADAFARGVIRSATDYSVYAQGIPGEKNGMGGVDLAFYKNRAFYHTPFDSIPGMGRDEGRKALWAMMETTQGVGLQLLNGADAEDTSSGVYFDCESVWLDTCVLLRLYQYWDTRWSRSRSADCSLRTSFS